MKNIFICGESYIGYTVHIKGADTMATSGYFENVGWLRAALEAGAEEIWFLGSTGSRLDHVLSNIFNLGLLRERGVQGWIADSTNLITMPVGRKITIRKEEQFGKYVSLVPFTSQITGLTLRGFAYNVDNVTLTAGTSLGISNEIQAEEAVIDFQEGILLVMESRD